MSFAELCATTNFSFLRGASHPEEMALQASRLGLAGLGVADRCTVAGLVRAHVAAREHGVRLAVGARLVFTDGTPDVLAYPKDRAAWGRLCRLLTVGNRRAPKGECWLTLEDVLAHAQGLQCIVLGDVSSSASGGPSPRRGDGDARALRALSQTAGAVWLAVPARFDGEDQRRRLALRALAEATGARLIATAEPLMHAPERRPLLDVVTCVREKTTLDAAGARLAANAERRLKSPQEIRRLFADMPEAVDETLRFLAGLDFSLDDLRYEYPDETTAGFPDPQHALESMSWAGARRRYPGGVPAKIRDSLDRELKIIGKLKYAPYFLTVADIVRFARASEDDAGAPKEPILCQGRGSAANSTVCYCLGITSVDPNVNELLFDRFVSEERGEPPDIDVDFEHERREEVIQYVYRKYGRHRAGLAATLICYRGRSAIREVGKAFGFSEDRIAALAKAQQWWSTGVLDEDLKRQGFDPSDRRLGQCLAIVRQLHGFPRHLSQHVGGFVMTRGRLDELVPIQNAAMEDRTVVEWDKDDLDALGILKVDLLGLGMLSCLKKAFGLLDAHYPGWLGSLEKGEAPAPEALAPQALAPALPAPDPPGSGSRTPCASGMTGREQAQDVLSFFSGADDPSTYAMLQRADSVGVFQVESRAQMSMLPRLKPKEFYDLVIEVAIVRPGPIQGGMVHPYLKRRQGLEKVVYPSKALEAVLKRTLGVPLFQEQAMQIAIVAAGFSPPEADKLRRAMATFRRVGTIGQLRAKFIEGMLANGYALEFAERSFAQIEGFGEYGFPESHAASFALLVYVSSWLKCHYPDVFAAALLNAQPMGFYAPAQIVRDAVEHGVEVRAIDVNLSDWDNTLEPNAASRKQDAVIPDAPAARSGTRESHAPALQPLFAASAPLLHPRHASMRDDILTMHAMRLGFRQAKGLKEDEFCALVANRGKGYDSVRDVWLRGGLSQAAIERLADADAFRSLGLDRRAALWAARGLNRVGGQEDVPLFALAADPSREPDFALPSMCVGEHVVEDYRTLGLSLKAHPCGLLRTDLAKRGAVKSETLATMRNGARVRAAGLVLVRQRPGTASGVIFMTLEDETGIANIVVWPKVFEQYRPQVLGARLCAVDGVVQSESGVIHVVADRLHDWNGVVGRLSETQIEPPLARADEVRRPGQDQRGHDQRGHDQRGQDQRGARRGHDMRGHPRNVRFDFSTPDAAEDVMPKGRNFH